MSYAEYRAWRDAWLKTHAPHRLDCMNPERALAYLRPTVAPATATVAPAQATATGAAVQPIVTGALAQATATVAEAVAAWSRAGGVALAADGWVAGSGVRALLAGVFEALAGAVERWWLPGDVYPAYWSLSQSLPRRRFWTLPTIDWRFLDDTGPRDALLLPHPLVPAGRPLAAEELLRLHRWVEAAPGRWLLVDAAYQLTTPLDDGLRALVAGGRTVVLWSLAKPWLARELLGMAALPSPLQAALQPRVAPPEPAALARAVAILTAAPSLPARQARRFAVEWARLTPLLRAACPSWEPPAHGYFSVVPVSFEQLRDRHDILSVPASVFGSERRDLAVITCLHDLEAHDPSAAA
jgi:hypothetical protein